MPPLSKEQQKFYENAIEMAKRHIEEIDTRVEDELARVKERLSELQQERDKVLEFYDKACVMLGVENEMKKQEGSAAGAEEALEA